MTRVAILDYGLGNLDSVARAVENCGGDVTVTDQADDITEATHLILPGVGAYADGMQNLRARGLDQVIVEFAITRQRPLLGICLGMQLLATTGAEGGETSGLGLIKGSVVRLVSDHPMTRIPHIGWNNVHHDETSPLFEGIPSGRDFYFVHSYHLIPKDSENVLARTPYCGGVVTAVGNQKVFGVQFHPEKSLRDGFQLLRNFLAI